VLSELAARFDIADVGHSAGVFDAEKLNWANRHYLKAAAPDRLAALVIPHLQRAGWLADPTDADRAFLTHVIPAVAAAVDRLEQVPGRLRFLFQYSAERLGESEALREELQQNFKAVLQGGLAKLDLVTREEFEVQRAVLLRTRQKLDELQRTVAEVEAQLGNAAADGKQASDDATSARTSTPH
jgi:BMFP domain-containing protein YqiC